MMMTRMKMMMMIAMMTKQKHLVFANLSLLIETLVARQAFCSWVDMQEI